LAPPLGFQLVGAIRNAIEGDKDGVVAVLTRAFAGDAIVRFLFPDEATYPARAAAFFGHYFDVRLAGGEVFVAGDVLGASLWNPPGGNRLGAAFVAEHWERFVVPAFEPVENARYSAFVEALDGITPAERHWYLGLLGVDPVVQGTGLARALLEPVLAEREAPVFLETGMERNLDFYARFGFKVIAEADVPGGPHVWGLALD
jgi:GNAT superfamily N-acetyltransferase